MKHQDINERRLKFFKDRIIKQLDSIKEDLGEWRYKLYVSIVEQCDNYEELRDMAELELQMDLIEYTRNNILNRLKEEGVTIQDLKRAIGVEDNYRDFEELQESKVEDMGEVEKNDGIDEIAEDEEMEEVSPIEIYSLYRDIINNKDDNEVEYDIDESELFDEENQEKNDDCVYGGQVEEEYDTSELEEEDLGEYEINEGDLFGEDEEDEDDYEINNDDLFTSEENEEEVDKPSILGGIEQNYEIDESDLFGDDDDEAQANELSIFNDAVEDYQIDESDLFADEEDESDNQPSVFRSDDEEYEIDEDDLFADEDEQEQDVEQDSVFRSDSDEDYQVDEEDLFAEDEEENDIRYEEDTVFRWEDPEYDINEEDLFDDSEDPETPSRVPVFRDRKDDNEFDIDTSDLFGDDDEYHGGFGGSTRYSDSYGANTRAVGIQQRKSDIHSIFNDGTERGMKTQQMFSSINRIINGTGKFLKNTSRNVGNNLKKSDLFKLQNNMDDDDEIIDF